MPMWIFLDANICLDLLDRTRPTSEAAVKWYMMHKDDEDMQFFFSGDFITTIFYILNERKKFPAEEVVAAIDALCEEIVPFYLEHSDYLLAKASFDEGRSGDFEDLMILASAKRAKCDLFLTNDTGLLGMGEFSGMRVENLSMILNVKRSI